MIRSTLIEQKAAALFLFAFIETRLFRAERTLTITGQLQYANLDPNDCCQVSTRRWQVPFNPEQSSFDGCKQKKVVLVQTIRSFDLRGPMKLVTFRMFAYSKMEHKINKTRRNLYTSGKTRI